MFLYKTRGMASPQGKRRVYFTCYPEDHERFFEQISNELLKIADCAVWYNPDEVYEDIELDLGQMTLLVVPVTTKLLTKPCRAMSLDVPFALKNHIPILPLMQEGGLDEMFTRLFGDLQYLDPNIQDESAISYEEKLKKFLNSVLIGDELAAKVRAAFDAYIFLSYRKKDRKYANELMRLIHKNAFCRDIAIWYDEYLTPGEDFNQAISEALQKSDLFALVVTPNLVNEINYVWTVEYPAAAEQKKTVLPAEMVRTDRDALIERYPAIPKGVDARDRVALSSALESALVNIAYAENDSDPQHCFFIGLAYLDGIDVEVDHERALSLITFAAESEENKVPEAIEKLVSMYSEGHGVERDYRTAVEWQRKLTEHFEEEYQGLSSMENYRKFFSALWGLGDQLWALRDLDDAEASYKRMLELCKGIPGGLTGASEAQRDLWVCYNNLGDLRIESGDIDGAEAYYREGLVLIELLAEATGTLEARRDLSVSYERLGDLRTERGDLDGAEAYYQKSHALIEWLAEETGTAKSRRNLSVSYGRLGDICKAQGDQDGAEELYRKGFALREQLVEETRSAEARRDLSLSYYKIGDLLKAKGDLDGAEVLYRKGFALSKQLVEETGTVVAQWDVMVSYDALGDLRKAWGDLDDAEAYYRKSLAMSEQLAEETGTVKARRDLSLSYERLADLRTDRDDLDGAEDYYRESLALREQLTEETGTVEARRDLSISYSKFGDIRKDRGDLDGAKVLYQKSFELRERLVEETKTVEARRDLLICYNKLGNLFTTMGDLNGAEGYYRKGIALSEWLIKNTGTVEAYDDMARLYCAYAGIREPYDRSLLEKALEIYTYLAEKCPHIVEYSENSDLIRQMLELMD